MENKVNEAAAKAQKPENAAASNAAAIVEPAAETKTQKTEPTKEPKQPKKGKNTPKRDGAAAEAFEEAQLEALERQREIEAKQKELQSCLKELERKKRLSENRSKFIEKLEELEEAEKQINPNDFECKRFKLYLTEISDNGYSRDGISVSITNSGLILNFIAMLKAKSYEKVAELEAELIK